MQMFHLYKKEVVLCYLGGGVTSFSYANYNNSPFLKSSCRNCVLVLRLAAFLKSSRATICNCYVLACSSFFTQKPCAIDCTFPHSERQKQP